MKEPRRFTLTCLPTPLVRARRLEARLGVPAIYIKRDDLLGFGVAGNKARKLELLVADALEHRADVLVTGGGPGSNHCAATAAAARVAGLDCDLVLYGEEGQTHPNLSLARSLGARVLFSNVARRASVDERLGPRAAELRAAGRRPYVIPRGGASPLGAAAYALAARELCFQMRERGEVGATVVVATGSGGTQAGLVAGMAALGHPHRIVGASVSRSPEECRTRVDELARAAAEVLGVERPGAEDVLVLDARGPGYGVGSDEGTDAAEFALHTEGLLLDPVFTSKAFAALLAITRSGATPVVFVHTGGLLPALAGRLTSEGRRAVA